MVGEHIRTLRGGRWSHAIDCGDGTVIHLAADARGRARIRRSYRPAFVGGAEAVQVVTHRERTFPAREIVARAFSRNADPAVAAMFRDSEAFAAWCATGRVPPPPPGVALASPPGSAPAAAPAPAAPSRPSAEPAPTPPAAGTAPGPAGAPRPRRRPAPAPRAASGKGARPAPTRKRRKTRARAGRAKAERRRR